MKTVNIALLGRWHVHAHDYANQITRNENAKLCCIWDDNEAWGKETAEKYDIPYVPALDTVLADASIDAVAITTATSAHREVMVKCANAGKHIFTEKVLALTMEDALAIKEAVVKNSVQFCISYPHRVHAHNLKAKEILDSGKLGDVSYMRVRNAHNGESAGWLPAHFYNEAEAGGGAMVDLGAHPMYLCRWLMGRPAAIRSTFTVFGDKGLDDNDVSVLEYANGAIAIAETGFMTASDPFSLELCGTKGRLQVNRGVLSYFDGEVNGWVVPNLPRDATSPLDQWVNAIMGTGSCEFNIDEAVALTEIMEAAYVSYRENRSVTL